MKMMFKMLPIFLSILILGGCGSNNESDKGTPGRGTGNPNDDYRRDRERENGRLERERGTSTRGG
jgi:uncharacterized protein YceK